MTTDMKCAAEMTAKSKPQKAEDETMPLPLKEPIYFDYCSFKQEKMTDLAKGTYEDRRQAAIPVSKATTEQTLKHEPMTLVEELCTTLFLAFGVPVGVFNIPILLYLIGRFVVGDVGVVFKCFGLLVLLPLALLPQPFIPSIQQSWLSMCIAKYFSWRYVLEEFPNPNRPRIMVGPPHGVFPYGAVLTMLGHRSMTGVHCRGLAASAAVRTPIFKQILVSIGVVDANRFTARKILEKPSVLGISTGGVAEIFETNNEDEVILLRERKGLIKLAIRTGADLQPCYIFGNTKLLKCWHGEGIPGGKDFLAWASRRVGFGLILVFGRFGLPIPIRMPCLGVTGKSIPTHHMQCEEPTEEQVQTIQDLLIQKEIELFHRYKHLYGWDEKHLIIK